MKHKKLFDTLLGFTQQQKFGKKRKWASAKFNTVRSMCPRTAAGSCSAAPVGEISNTLRVGTVQRIDTFQSRFEQMFGNCVQLPLGFGKRSLKTFGAEMNILFLSCPVDYKSNLLYLVLSVFFDGHFTLCQSTGYNHSNKSVVTQTESEKS